MCFNTGRNSISNSFVPPSSHSFLMITKQPYLQFLTSRMLEFELYEFAYVFDTIASPSYLIRFVIVLLNRC